ncbi:hypothetical protein [Tenacibaculum soleae]|uniref:hypothetical protein n=1 Tax=Tenacibaculum soleae TaxID=447689 RepID=UPI003AB1E76C
MKSIKEHIIFSLLVIGIISLTFSVNDSSIFNQFLVETELEESISEIDDLSSVIEITNSDNGGNNGYAIVAETKPLPSYFSLTSSIFATSNEVTKKHPFFILYCCLKIDC